VAFEAPLAPGRYVMFCNLGNPETERSHADEFGMVAEFTVE
jgi:hypothetical protein